MDSQYWVESHNKLYFWTPFQRIKLFELKAEGDPTCLLHCSYRARLYGRKIIIDYCCEEELRGFIEDRNVGIASNVAYKLSGTQTRVQGL